MDSGEYAPYPYPRSRKVREAIDRHDYLTEGKIRDERRSVKHNEARWPMYAPDMAEYVESFGRRFPSALQIPARIAEKRHKTKQKILVLDIAGAADGKSIGADVTINAVLDRGKDMPKKDTRSRIIVAGDLVTNAGREALFRAIDKTGLKISFAFCRLGFGLIGEDENPYTRARLLKLYKGIQERMDDDGESYAELWDTGFKDELVRELDTTETPYENNGDMFHIAANIRTHSGKETGNGREIKRQGVKQ